MSNVQRFTPDLIVKIDYTEDIEKVLAKIRELDFDNYRVTTFHGPFIGLRKGSKPVLGIKLRSMSLVERIRDKIEIIQLLKNPRVEPETTPQIDIEPELVDWKEKYLNLAKDVVDSQYNLGVMLDLVICLEKELEDEQEN